MALRFPSPNADALGRMDMPKDSFAPSKRKKLTSIIKASVRGQRSHRTFYHTGVSSETPTLGVRVFDTYGISTTNLILTLRNCGLRISVCIHCVDMWTKEGVLVMVSNSDTKFIRDLYKGYQQQVITTHRNISCNGDTRGKTSEVLIMNYE